MARRCNQCTANVIMGIFVHEHGCPNEKKIWHEGRQEWEDMSEDEDDFFEEELDENDGDGGFGFGTDEIEEDYPGQYSDFNNPKD